MLSKTRVYQSQAKIARRLVETCLVLPEFVTSYSDFGPWSSAATLYKLYNVEFVIMGTTVTYCISVKRDCNNELALLYCASTYIGGSTAGFGGSDMTMNQMQTNIDSLLFKRDTQRKVYNQYASRRNLELL